MAFTTLFLSVTAAADAPPEDLRAKLGQILSRKEFQPREYDISYWEKIREYCLSILRDALEWVGSWFHIPNFGGSYLASWATSLLFLLKTLFWVLIGGVLCAFAYLLLKNMKQRYFPNEEKLIAVVKKALEPTIPLGELFSAGRFRELLASLRLVLRNYLLDHYKLATATTDRELARALPESEPRKGIFQKIALTFEKVAFAGVPLLETDVRSYYTKFQESFAEDTQ